MSSTLTASTISTGNRVFKNRQLDHDGLKLKDDLDSFVRDTSIMWTWRFYKIFVYFVLWKMLIIIYMAYLFHKYFLI